MTIVLALFLLVFIVAILVYLFPLANVVGNSMLPTYHEREILLCRRVLNKHTHNYKDGEVYVFRAPYDDEEVRFIIKRASFFIEQDGVMYAYLLGDNPSESYDSRQYGLVSCNYAVAKVLRVIKKKV